MDFDTFDTAGLGLTAESTDITCDVVDRPDSPTILHPELPRLEQVVQPFLPQLESPVFQPAQAEYVAPTQPSLDSAPIPEATSIPSDGLFGGSKRCVLLLADGTKLIFDQSEVPPTEPFRYASDIQRLINSWDDASSEWNPPSSYPISIQGCAIPIKFWKILYKHNRTTGEEWKRLKNAWNNWRFFMERYQALGPEAFWTRYSNARGQRLSYSRISKHLRDERKANDENLVKRLRQEYGNRFEAEFGYYDKNKKWVPMTSDSKIARRYRKKMGLGSEEDDDEDD
ncbi:uncharacterized protein EV420DRAFT_1270884 [Desarmillaria tabescens]|uniref:Uncharacterized protein n=1 Tax=Armillaria tabescens TaxID=1929756 RepID=A0AA39KFS3_ARMTA|nr:uncharacterized protein EV420DRAFT_1270884 [Desarmillaria tabescens]KAK0457948.1 hypothetical protein EV420DRAFT_1270884 [Desarmillaria tabescens]